MPDTALRDGVDAALCCAWRQTRAEWVFSALLRQYEGIVRWVICRTGAYKWARPWLDEEDLVAAGRLGLLDAAEKHDAERGAFITFAVLNIRHRLATQRQPLKAAKCQGYEVSIDEPLTEDGFTLADTLAAPPAVPPGTVSDAAAVLGLVDGRNRELLELYFMQGLTLEEIGARYGVGKERASQLLRRALRLARKRAHAHALVVEGLRRAQRTRSYRPAVY